MAGVNNWRVSLPWPLPGEDQGAVEYSYEDDDGVTKTSFSSGKALAAMLLTDSVFLNSHWWNDEWPEDARKAASLNININDVFAWGCADAESMNYHEIEKVYRYWVDDRSWGTAVWAIIKRRELPQKPVLEAITAAGWDIDALTAEHGLRPNYYDGVSGVLARRKYDVYSEWARSNGEEPVPFTAGWWEKWREWEKAHPGYYDDAWKAADKELVAQWAKENGHEQ